MIPVTALSKRVLVWRNGLNETDHGPLLWTDRSRSEVMRTYQRRGNLLLVDVNHNYNEEERAKWEASGEAAPTAGYASLELASDGSLWMVPEWSDYALEKIRGREMRYVSPDFSYDKKTRELLDIFRISLVAEPGTWGARLVASSKRGRLSMGVSPEMLAKLTELATAMATENVSDTVKGLVNEAIAMASTGDVAPPSPADDVMGKDPKDPPPAMSSAYASQADRFAKRRADLEARNLCSALRDSARRELNTTPAEEQELSKYNDPDGLERALGLLRASRGGKAPPPPVKEPTGSTQSAAKGPYTQRLAARGMLNGGTQ